MRIAEGNPGHRRVPDEPRALGRPVPPGYFDDQQRAVWNILLASVPNGMLAACDAAIMEILVQSWTIYRQASAEINRIGLMVRASDGPRRNPLIGIARGAAADLHMAASSLGLSPLARTRLQASAEKPFDPIELLLGGDDEDSDAGLPN